MTSRTGFKLACLLSFKLACLLTGLAFASLFFNPPARAEDGAWKVGASYVIRFQHLDLGRPADRHALLNQVERSAERLCEGQRTKARREACAEAAIASSLKSVPGHIRLAVDTARLERDGEQQAHR
jgi:UrcA family protein